MTNPIAPIIRRQRACRRYEERPVPESLIEEVLSAATFAPSSENFQPWHFVVVQDAARRERIGEHVRKTWIAGGGYRRAQERLPSRMAMDVNAGQLGGITAAPVLIVVAGDTTRVPMQWMASSIYPCVQNMLLTATALGLGSAMTTFVTNGDALSTIIGLPDHVVPMAMVPLGHPAKRLGPPQREPFQEHTSRETYGHPW